MAEDFVSVYRALDEPTANIVKAALEDAGIAAMVRPHHTSWFDGVFVPAEGSWGDVVVSNEDADKAVEFLQQRDFDSEEGK
jgi:type III secretory pathway lipoprotein EscJ